MLITFSSRILARFQTGPPEILADGDFAFRPDLSKILTARDFVSRRESRQHSHRDIRLPAKNPGKTPAGIPLRFWPPGSHFPPGSRRDFGRRESRLPPRIPARFPPGSRRDFGRREFRLPPRIPERFPPGSCRDFGRRESRLPPRIPVRILAAKISAGSRRESCRGFGKIPPRSRYHFYKGTHTCLTEAEFSHLLHIA